MELEKEKYFLGKCKDGDSAAFNYIVNEYDNRAYYYALNILHNYHDSVDSGQEFFVKAFRSIKKMTAANLFYLGF